MDNIVKVITGAIVTIVIGGAVYNVSQSDIIKNFAINAEITEEQAEQYVQNIPEDELASWTEIGYDLISDGQSILETSNEIDCVNYEYEWESLSLSCSDGKKQLFEIGEDRILLGESYVKMDLYLELPENEIEETIRLIDQEEANYDFEIFDKMFERLEIDEMKKTNSYNKALLQTALESMTEQ
jgi:hypothetical protein